MGEQAEGSEWVRVGDTVMLCNLSPKGREHASKELYAYSEGFLQHSVLLGDLQLDKSLLFNSLFRIELNLSQAGGQLNPVDRELETEANAQKLAQCNENLRFGMSIRLRHLFSDLCIGLDTVKPAETVGAWDVIVGQDSGNVVTRVVLQSLDKSKFRIGDDLKYDQPFILTFQADFLTFYTHVKANVVLCSDVKGSWKFVRTMKPPPDSPNLVELYSYVQICHQELDLALAAVPTDDSERVHKAALVNDNDQPSTIWLIEPMNFGKEATPVGAVCLKNVVTQQYLTVSEEAVGLASLATPVDIFAHQKTKSDQSTLEYGQTFRIVSESAYMITVNANNLKETSLKKLVTFQTMKETKQRVEVLRRPKKKKKEAMFYFDNVDQAESAKLNVVSRMKILLEKMSEEAKEHITASSLSMDTLKAVLKFKDGFTRGFLWLQDLIQNCPSEAYIRRRLLIVETGMHVTLGETCRHLVAISNMIGREAVSDPQIQATAEQGQREIFATIDSIARFLSEIAKGSRQIARRMLEPLKIFNSLTGFESPNIYHFVTAVLSRVSPLTYLESLEAAQAELNKLVQTLSPFRQVTELHIFQQAALLFQLRMCCYEEHNFLPWYARSILQLMSSRGLLPLFRLKASSATKELFVEIPAFTETASESFLQDNPKLKLDEASLLEGVAFISLLSVAELPGYHEYVFNYLMLLSTLAQVWPEDSGAGAMEMGVSTEVCVKLSREVSLSDFGTCGLKLVAKLLLTRNHTAVYPKEYVLDNCYYPSRCKEEDAGVTFLAADKGGKEVEEVVAWVSQFLFQKAQKYDNITVNKEHAIKYITTLLSTIRDLIEFGHTNKFFFYAVERYFPYLLLGFAGQGKGKGTWLSDRISEIVKQSEPGFETEQGVSRALVEDCYREVIHFGMYLMRLKRSFQLESLARSAFKETVVDWEQEITIALDTHLQANLEKCKQIRGKLGLLTRLPNQSAIPTTTAIFSELDTAEILDKAPDIKELLYQVVAVRSSLRSWEADQVKQYMECTYGEMEDVLHLLCKSELLEDSSHDTLATTLKSILAGGALDKYLAHHRMKGEESLEILQNCEDALRQLCSLIHPYSPNAKDSEVAAYRNVLRHNQVQAKVYRVWEVAYKQRKRVTTLDKSESPIGIIEKYCIQFFYNFAYSSSLNQRDLRKFFTKPLFTTQSPQLIDLLEMLEKFHTLTLHEKLLAVEEVLQHYVKGSGKGGKQPPALYLIEVLMFDSQGPVKEVQNAVLRAIISEMNTCFNDLTREDNLAVGSAYLRLISLACEGNVGMMSQAKILFTDKDFFAKVGTCGPKMLRAAWDFIGRVGRDEVSKYQRGVEKLIAATLAELDSRIFSRPEGLLQVAFDNACELLYTDAAVMSTQLGDVTDDVTDAVMLLGSRRFARPSGILPMLKAMSSGKNISQLCPVMSEFITSLANRLIDLQKKLEIIVTQSEDWKNVDMTGFLDVINDFLKFFGFLTPAGEERSVLRTSHSLHGAFLIQNALKKRNPMGELITKIYQDTFEKKEVKKVPTYISAILSNCKDMDLPVFVSQSRALLRSSDKKLFYFDLMRGLLLTVAPEEFSSLVIYMLENKVALDAVRALIVSHYENRLPALQLLITMLSQTDESIRARFRGVLEKYDLAVDLFDDLKRNLADVTVEQIQKYQDGIEETQDKQSLLRLECALKTLEFMQVLCDMCNLDYQRYILAMPGESRNSLLYESIKQLMTINEHRSALTATLQQPSNADYSIEQLHQYNAFNMDKTLQHLMFVRGRFQLAKVMNPEQPHFSAQMNLLTAAIIKTLIEAIIGPCLETQTFVGNFAMLHLTFNKILEMAWTQRQEATYKQLYDSCVDLLLALLDGEPADSVLQALSSFLDFDMLFSHLKNIYSILRTQAEPEAELKQTGINIFMLLLKWSYISLYPVDALKNFSLNSPDSGYFEYFIKCVGYVEIDTTPDDGKEIVLKSIYFPIPENLKYMTLESKNELLFDVDRNNQKDQIHDFLQREEIWRMELDHQKTLKGFKAVSVVTQHWRLYGQVAYTILLMNSLYLLFATTGQFTLSGVEVEGNIWKLRMLRLLGSAQLLLSTLHIISYAVEFLPNICMRIGYRVDIWNLSVELRRPSRESSAGLLTIVALMWRVLMDTYFFYYVLYFGFSCLALMYPFLYPFLLLDIVTKNSNLVTILQSITTNAWQLFLTFCLAIICIYVFSMFGYVFFQSSYEEIPCNTLLDCLASTFSNGVQNGGGIGDSLAPVQRDDPLFWGRFVYDLLYFIVIIVVLLNVIFGIILDTFGELRDDRNQKSQDIASTCYICGQTRSTLELKASGWKNHFTGEHSPFAYLAFLIYLDNKPEIECNGIEKYVKEKKSRMDHTFVPNTCKKLLAFESSSN